MNYRGLAIVTPIYQPKPNLLEILALERMVKIFQWRKIFFLAPDNLDTSWYENRFRDVEINRFDDECFLSLSSYNRMLLDVSFYRKWLELGLDSILISQMDAYVISDCLDDFLCMPYDYIGAPLFRLKNDRPCFYGGNGGFSLRRLQPCIRILKMQAERVETWRENEDEFFSYCGDVYPNEFRVAPLHIASQFAFDRFMRILYRLNKGKLPGAIHGWSTYDPYFSQRIIGVTDDLQHRCHIDDIRKIEEERCMAFARRHQPIILYGAGLWGKVFLRYFSKQGILVRCFAVSDTQLTGEPYLNVPLKHLSEISDAYLTDGMMFSISKRFMGEKAFADIREQVKHHGFLHCFELNTVQFNLAVESWLEEEVCKD